MKFLELLLSLLPLYSLGTQSSDSNAVVICAPLFQSDEFSIKCMHSEALLNFKLSLCQHFTYMSMKTPFETSIFKHIFICTCIFKSESPVDQDKIKIGVTPFMFVSLDVVDSKYMWNKGWKNKRVFKMAPSFYILVSS